MVLDIVWAVASLLLLILNYRMAKADGTWSWKLVLGFFAALAVFGAGYLWPMINSQWLEAHPDAFLWVTMGPGAVLVGGVLCDRGAGAEGAESTARGGAVRVPARERRRIQVKR